MERDDELDLTADGAGGDDTDKPLVAEEVVATYIADAARTVPGVVELHGSTWQELSERVRVDVPTKGILIHWSGPAVIAVDVHVKVAWGTVIPKLARSVQEAVIRKVESLLDIAVERVTLYVDEIDLPPAEQRD